MNPQQCAGLLAGDSAMFDHYPTNRFVTPADRKTIQNSGTAAIPVWEVTPREALLFMINGLLAPAV
jgi:hypothetical protein